jgi:hypothetical protein
MHEVMRRVDLGDDAALPCHAPVSSEDVEKTPDEAGRGLNLAFGFGHWGPLLLLSCHTFSCIFRIASNKGGTAHRDICPALSRHLSRFSVSLPLFGGGTN